jgi:hypothetical protein
MGRILVDVYGAENLTCRGGSCDKNVSVYIELQPWHVSWILCRRGGRCTQTFSIINSSHILRPRGKLGNRTSAVVCATGCTKWRFSDTLSTSSRVLQVEKATRKAKTQSRIPWKRWIISFPVIRHLTCNTVCYKNLKSFKNPSKHVSA